MSLKATYMKTFVADLSGLSVHDTDPLEDKLQMWRWETKISSRETHMNPFDSVKNTDSLAAESSVARKLKIVVPSMWGEKSVEGDGRQIQTPPVEITVIKRTGGRAALAAIHKVWYSTRPKMPTIHIAL